jgi:NAD(P)-dependent dehydrogenase (short-subunit alcohol dehydrogenase family)
MAAAPDAFSSPGVTRTLESMSDPRIVLLTGASSGIGRASAARLAQTGFRVFGMARTAPPAHDGGFAFLPGDIRDDGSVRECVSRVLREAGRVDVLVNCAGVIVAGPAEEMLPDEIMDQVQTNLLGTMRMCQAVLPAMRKQWGGRIITVGSLAGLMGLPFQSAYSASKYGIEGYSESLQMEVQGFGIRVVVVDPGDIATEITLHRKVTRGSGSGSPYKQNFDDAMRSQAESEKHGWKVERVARLIERVVRSRRPRFRYTPGPFVERISPVARRLIPDRLYLRILARFSGLRSDTRPSG